MYSGVEAHMEIIILHGLYVIFGLGTVYMCTGAYKHRNECEMKKATSLASIEADQRLLASNNNDERREGTTFVDERDQPRYGG